VWFAPDGAHLTVDAKLMLNQDRRTQAGSHKPAADVLFASMARAFAAEAAAVVLTGLGRDGAAGVRQLVAAGGYVIAQDEATSVVNGMPASAVEAGAQMVLPIDDVADALRALVPAGP
jgi:two-component system chemotaxis response regulator CheB